MLPSVLSGKTGRVKGPRGMEGFNAVPVNDVPHGTKIHNSRFVLTIKENVTQAPVHKAYFLAQGD